MDPTHRIRQRRQKEIQRALDWLDNTRCHLNISLLGLLLSYYYAHPGTTIEDFTKKADDEVEEEVTIREEWTATTAAGL